MQMKKEIIDSVAQPSAYIEYVVCILYNGGD